MRRLAAAAVALLAIAAIVGAWKLSTGGGTKLEGKLTFAVLAPSSAGGTLAARGQDLADGAEMAAAEVNDHGGLLGHKLAVEVVDDACSPLIAYEAAKSIAEGGGFAAAVGGTCDDAAAREIPVLDAGGVPFLVTTANRADLITPDLASTYLTNGTIYQQALSAVYWMNYRHAQRLAILGDTSPDSQALAKNAIRLIDQAPRLVSLQTIRAGRRDLDTEAKATVASRPDFVYWTGSATSGGALVRALREAGFKGTFTASAASESRGLPGRSRSRGSRGRVRHRHREPAKPAERVVVATALPGRVSPHARARCPAGVRRRTRARPGDAPGRRHRRHSRSRDNLPKLSEKLTTFLGVVRFARDHTLLYDNRVILVVKNGDFAWERSLRTDSLQG